MLIQSITAPFLIKYLQFVESPPIKAKLLKNTLKKLILVSNMKEEELKNNKYMRLASWDQVSDLAAAKTIENTVINMTGMPET